MAVKVMIAPAIAVAEVKPPRKKRDPNDPAKPKRRRSAVYDADGSEVFITLMCLKCHKTRPLAQFGLRKMADGAIRNQPWCRSCRSSAGVQPVKGEDSAVAVESALAAEAALAAETAAVAETKDPAALPGDVPALAPVPEDAKPTQSAGSLAAQVAAALSAGQG